MTNFTWEDFDESFLKEFQRIGVVNLGLFGKTGVGKSTLVNTFFGSNVSATGIGEPVTKDLSYFRLRNRPFGFFDSPGFEVGQSSQELLAQIREHVTSQRNLGVDRQIHVAWYCVRAADRRFEAVQADFVRSLVELRIPVILVMTQVNKKGERFDPEAEQLRDSIRAQFQEGPQPHAIVMLNARANEFTEIPQHGLETLLERTSEVVPEGVRQALVAAQQVDVQLKRRTAWKAVKQSSASAAMAAAQPIPVASLVALIPIETVMLARVSAVYGVGAEPSNVKRLAFAALGTLGFRATTSLAISQVLKSIPGIGALAGGLLNATAASTLTLAMGSAWMRICESMLDSGQTMSEADVQAAFKQAVRQGSFSDLD